MKKILILFIVLIPIQFNINAQNKTGRLISKIEKQKFLFVDQSMSPKSVKYATELLKKSTEKDLIELSKKDCKLCFSYAFWVMSVKNSDKARHIYNSYKKDDISDYKYIELNRYKKNKGCIKLLIPEFTFIEDIYEKKKYLDLIN